MPDRYYAARDEHEAEDATKNISYRLQKTVPAKTKGYTLKENTAGLPKHSGQPLPSLDDESLAEVVDKPLLIDEARRTPDVHYKSEVIDTLGAKCKSGVFGTKQEPPKALADRRAEIEATIP